MWPSSPCCISWAWSGDSSEGAKRTLGNWSEDCKYLDTLWEGRLCYNAICSSHPNFRVSELMSGFYGFYLLGFWKSEEWIKIFINGRIYFSLFLLYCMGFPDGSSNKMSTCNAGDSGDTGSILGPRRFPGGENDNPLQYSCLGNPMERGAWWTTAHGVAKNWAWLSMWWVDELYFMPLLIQHTGTEKVPYV